MLQIQKSNPFSARTSDSANLSFERFIRIKEMSSSNSESSGDSSEEVCKSGTKSSRIPKGIAPILRTVNFPNHIKSLAIQVYDKLDIENHKSVKRLKIACYCVYQAYEIYNKGSNKPISVIEIGNRLGLTPAESKNAINNRPKYKDGFKPFKCVKTTADIIYSYIVEECNQTEDLAFQITADLNLLLKQEPEFKTCQTQTLIAGFIMYWMPLNSYKIDEKKLATYFGLSPGAIKSMCSKIKKSIPLHIKL